MNPPEIFLPPQITGLPAYESDDWTFTNDGTTFTVTVTDFPANRCTLLGNRIEILGPNPDQNITFTTETGKGSWDFGIPALEADYTCRLTPLFLFGRATLPGGTSEKTTTVGSAPTEVPAYTLSEGDTGDVQVFVAPDPDQAGNPPTIQFLVKTGADITFARWTTNRTLGNDSLGNQLIKASTYNASTNPLWLTRNVNGLWADWLDRSNSPGAREFVRFRYTTQAGGSIQETTVSDWSNEVDLVMPDVDPGDPTGPDQPTAIASTTATAGRVTLAISGPSNTGTSPLASYTISESGSTAATISATGAVSVTLSNGAVLSGSSPTNIQVNFPTDRQGSTASFTVRAVNEEGLISDPRTTTATIPGTVTPPPVGAGTWRLNDVLTQSEYNAGPPYRNSGEQLPHAYDACEANGNFILFYQDTGCPIISQDGGLSWVYPTCEGLDASNAVDCRWDPVNTSAFFVIASTRNSGGTENGIYFTNNRGRRFRRLFRASRMGQWSGDAACNSSPAYDPSSISGGMARTWYIPLQPNNDAFPALTRPDLAAITQRLIRITNLDQSGEEVRELHALPASTVGSCVSQSRVDPGNTSRLYMACANGLFQMNLSNGALTEITNGLPGSQVTSIECNANGTEWTCCVLNNGLWRASSPTGPWTRFRAASNITQHSVCVSNRNRILYRYATSNPRGEVWCTTGGTSGSWYQSRVDPSDTSRLSNLNRGRGHGYIWNPTIQNRINGFGNTSYMTISTDSGVNIRSANIGFTGNSWGRGGGEFGFDIGNAQRYMFGFNDVNVKSTTNGGLWWEDSSRAPGRGSSDSNGLVASIQPVAGSNIWLATISGSYNNGQVYRSTTAGRSPAPGVSGWSLVIDSTSGRNLYHGWNLQNPQIVWTGERRSTNAGQAWTAIPSLSGRMVCAISRSNGAVVYALQDGAGRRNVFICENGNAGSPTFSAAFDALIDITQDGRPVVLLRVNPQDPYEVWTRDPSGGLARWRRSGSNWSRFRVQALEQRVTVSPNGNRVADIAIDPRFPDIIYVVMEGRGVRRFFRTINGGGAFTDITDGFPMTEYNGMAVSPVTGDLHVGSSAGSRIYPPPYTSGPTTNWSRLSMFTNNVLF